MRPVTDTPRLSSCLIFLGLLVCKSGRGQHAEVLRSKLGSCPCSVPHNFVFEVEKLVWLQKKEEQGAHDELDALNVEACQYIDH